MGSIGEFISSMMELVSGSLDLIIIIFAILIILLWILLPFAVFGTKDRLDKLIRLQEKTLEAIKHLNQESSQLQQTNSKDTTDTSNENLVSVQEYAHAKGMSESLVISGLMYGNISGKKIDGVWYVNKN